MTSITEQDNFQLLDLTAAAYVLHTNDAAELAMYTSCCFVPCAS